MHVSEPTKQPRHPAQTGTVRETRAPPHTKRGQCANREHRPTRKRSKRSNGAPRNGKICAPCMIRGARAAKSASSWQDLRAVYPPTAICGAFRIHGAHILPKPARFRMHGARILPRSPPFLVRGPFLDTWSAKLATDRHSGTHQGIILPWPASRKCTAATSCHGSLLQECFSTTYCQEGPRLPGLAAKSQWCHEVGRPRPNVTSANSTPHADTSKKP